MYFNRTWIFLCKWGWGYILEAPIFSFKSAGKFLLSVKDGLETHGDNRFVLLKHWQTWKPNRHNVFVSLSTESCDNDFWNSHNRASSSSSSSSSNNDNGCYDDDISNNNNNNISNNKNGDRNNDNRNAMKNRKSKRFGENECKKGQYIKERRKQAKKEELLMFRK